MKLDQFEYISNRGEPNEWRIDGCPDRGTSKLKSLCSMEYRYRLKKKISHI